MKTTTLLLNNSVNHSPVHFGLFLIPLVLACFSLSPTAQAALPPPAPDGGYDGGNTAEGNDALFSVQFNSMTGDGSDNTALGLQALTANTTGSDNTATGSTALFRNTTGFSNTATGYQALVSNTTGSENTAVGTSALLSNVTGIQNTATGAGALFTNKGSNNTATGFEALIFNTTGFSNTAVGTSALFSNLTGVNNTANGVNALFNNTSGTYNTADGVNALHNNTTGSGNVAIGANAGKNLTTGGGNVCIGVNVLGVAGENDTTRIKNVYSSVASGRAVYVNADNKIGTLSSSRRYKEEIKPMDKGSDTLLALKPVTFRYKKEIDASRTKQFGLVAEDVEKVDPDLVTRDGEGKPETVRYEAVNAMLLNEFLKEQRTVQEQQKEIDALKAELKEQKALLQKVSAQLATASPSGGGFDLSNPTARSVANSQ